MMTAVIAIASRDPVIARNSLIGNPFVSDDTSHNPLKGPPETVTNRVTTRRDPKRQPKI